MLSSFKLRVVCLLGALVSAGFVSTQLMADRKDERRIAFYNIHTKETVDVVYMRGGKRIPEAMSRINWVMRDWRRNEATKMSPELIDILWELKTELGAVKPIHIISGYRSEKTNSMLRQTRGGQARKSQHILGTAADVHFPDVPLKKLRYSALVREKGGVGYYPTSAIPFVHVDTGNVRHWPRLPRHELALLFPNGQTRHVPADGRQISKADVQVARRKHRELATQIAQFHDLRARPRAPAPVLVASGWSTRIQPQAHTQPRDAEKPGMPTAPYRVASLGSILPPSPKLAERPSKFRTGPNESDRQQLSELVAKASVNPLMGLFSALGQGQTDERNSLKAALADERAGRHGDSRFSWSDGWVSAPEYDEEHPDELFYRPFPLGPMLTTSASADDPALAKMQHPDVAATLEFISDEIHALPMRFTPGHGIAELLWTQQFTPVAAARPGVLENRRIQTSMR